MTESLARSAAIARNEVTMLRRDAAPLVGLVVLPLLIIVFLRPAMQSVLVLQGYPAASGLEQVVPGITVMFSMFLVSSGGLMFFREHGWGTWDRVRLSGVRMTELLLGKMVPLMLLLLVQYVAVFGVSSLLLGFELRGSLLAALAVWAAFAISLVCLTWALFSLCRSDQQMIALTNIVAILFGGFGGAFVPVALLPSWAQAVAPATPSYWAITGFRTVTLDTAGLGGVLGPVAALLAFAGGFLVIAGLRLRYDTRKGSYRH